MPLKDKKARAAYQLAWYHKNRDRILAKLRPTFRSEANREKNRKWRELNRERDRASHRASKKRNRLKNLEYNRKWKDANREHVRARDNAYNAKNRKHQREMHRLRYQRDPLKYRLRAHEYRVKKLKAPGKCSRDQLHARYAYFGWKCVYCGKTDVKLEADHKIPLTRGGSNWPSNFVPACVSCNRRKSTMTYKEYTRRRSQ